MPIDHKCVNTITDLSAQLFESSPDCVKLLDAQGRIAAMNVNGQCVMEIDDFKAIAGKSWKALWPEQNHAELDQALVDAVHGKVGHFNGYCPTAKGTPKWWDVIVTPVRSSEGNIDSFLSVSRDVTEMHQANMERERLVRELRATNERITNIFRQAPAFMCVLRGPEHVFELVNERYLQLVGNRNLIGQSLRQALPEVDGQGYLELLDEVYRTGEHFNGTDMPVLLQRTDDGLLEKRFIDFVLMPLRNADGTITGILAHGVDQTDRKNAEIALYDSRERLQKIVKQAGTGVVETDANGCITLVNQKYCDLLGYSEGDLLGMHVLDITAPDSLFATREALGGLIAGGPGFVLDKQYRHKDGSLRWATSSVNALRDPAGAYQGIVAIVVDITESRQAAEKLRASEERYRTLFENMDQGFCLIEIMYDAAGKPIDFRLLEMNGMFEKHTGLSNAANRTARELVPDMDDFWVETYSRVALTGEPLRFEHRDAAMNRWFDVHATRIGAADSKKVALLFRDISVRKQGDEALRSHAARQAFQLQLADRLRPLTVPDDVTAAASALLGRYLQISRVSYCEVDDVNGTFVIRHDWNNEGIATIAGGIRRLDDFGPEMVAHLRSGQKMVVDDVTLEPRTAAYVDAYKKIGVRANAAIPLFKGGRFTAILSLHSATPHHWTEQDLALAEDTVERTWAAVDNAAAQHALRIERDRSQAVLDSMTEGFAIFDRNWTVLQMNAAGLRIVHKTPSEVIGKSHWEIWPQAKGTDGERMYRRVMESRTPEVLEYFHTFDNGPDAWIELRAYPAGVDELAIFFRDVTERKTTEEKLRIADRRKDEFLAMLAHELRNPLAPISAAAQLLQTVKLDEARVRQTSQIIGRQVVHMTHLVDDLLDVSRVTRGLVKLENASLDIRHIVADAVEQVTPLMQSRRHHLALHLPPVTAMVEGDKKRLVQVISNLLNNAAKYTNDGGHILLSTDVRDEHVMIEVTDNGIGMTADLAAHAFDLFAQAERSSDRSSGGLGLGLALVKSLVELHDGKVMCESEGIGKGSKFTVYLPRLAVEDRLEGDHPTDRAGQPATKPLRIMVVDDNVDAAAMLTMLLEAAGHQVMVAHGSRLALERAVTEVPDVFLLDIGLPEMDGNELAQRLRSSPRTAGSLIIAVTGYGQENDRNRTREAGFDHHLVKPVDAGKLTSILAAIS